MSEIWKWAETELFNVIIQRYYSITLIIILLR